MVEEPGPVVRPYAWTRGRTRPRLELAVEALVTSTVRGAGEEPLLSPERAGIIRCCMDPRSVAEVSATMKIPLGVARVLVGDMADEGLVAVHQPQSLDDDAQLALLERVLSGLRRL